MKLIILIGLPASGKSFFAYSFSPSKFQRIDLDRQLRFYNLYDFKKSNVETFLISEFERTIKMWHKDVDFILDGLLLKNETYIKIIQLFILAAKANNKSINSIELHYWKPDREVCLWNDLGRNRRINSITTIKNAPIEYPDVSYIISQLSEENKKINVCIIEHLVVKKNSRLIFNDEPAIISELFYSDEVPRHYNWSEIRDILDVVNPNMLEPVFRKIVNSASETYSEEEIREDDNGDDYTEEMTHFEISGLDLERELKKYKLYRPKEIIRNHCTEQVKNYKEPLAIRLLGGGK